MTRAQAPKPGWLEGYPINGKVWFRESTNEWVLELTGTINDCNFTYRHTAPASEKPEDVPGLGRLYQALRGSISV